MKHNREYSLFIFLKYPTYTDTENKHLNTIFTGPSSTLACGPRSAVCTSLYTHTLTHTPLKNTQEHTTWQYDCKTPKQTKTFYLWKIWKSFLLHYIPFQMFIQNVFISNESKTSLRDSAIFHVKLMFWSRITCNIICKITEQPKASESMTLACSANQPFKEAKPRQRMIVFIHFTYSSLRLFASAIFNLQPCCNKAERHKYT